MFSILWVLQHRIDEKEWNVIKQCSTYCFTLIVSTYIQNRNICKCIGMHLTTSNGNHSAQGKQVLSWKNRIAKWFRYILYKYKIEQILIFIILRLKLFRLRFFLAWLYFSFEGSLKLSLSIPCLNVFGISQVFQIQGNL